MSFDNSRFQCHENAVETLGCNWRLRAKNTRQKSQSFPCCEETLADHAKTRKLFSIKPSLERDEERCEKRRRSDSFEADSGIFLGLGELVSLFKTILGNANSTYETRSEADSLLDGV